MNYKQKKHFRQSLDFNAAISNTNLFFVFQVKAVHVSKWISFKKLLLRYNLKAKIFSIKSFKKNNFFSLKSLVVTNLYNGKIVVIYPEKKLVCCSTLQKIISLFNDNFFLIPLHAFLNKSFFSFNRLKFLIDLCSKNSKIELMQLMLHSHQFVIFFDKALYNYLYILKKIV